MTSHNTGLLVASVVVCLALFAISAEGYPLGDTLTVVMRPISSVPAIVPRGESFSVHCLADPGTQGWNVTLVRWGIQVPLAVSNAAYHASLERWVMWASVPGDASLETYDLVVTASGVAPDTARNAVRVLETFPDSFYVVHLTDTHLPTTLYWYETGAETDSSCIDDYRAVIEDLNIINPEFAVHTGDVVNEGELEDYLDRRYYSRTKHLMAELTVPQYVVAGNHDVGGWNSTPPPDGTARRSWWRFFGWPYLEDPPSGDHLHTQNYSFDFGSVHFAGMEAYINYDGWRYGTYGNTSFTQDQMVWLQQDLEQAQASPTKVLFYHYDFQGQLDPGSLPVDLYLWGHIHQDNQTQHGDAWSIATDPVCGGRRSYRIIRFTPNGIHPSPTLSAGTSGQSLAVTYSPDNDGSATEVSAAVYNAHNQRFEHARLRFLMAPEGAPYRATGGELYQAIRTTSAGGDSVVVCYVRVDIQPRSSATVTVGPSTAAPDVLVLHEPVSIDVGPNPLRTGDALWVRWAWGPPSSATLVGVGGRVLVSDLPLRPAGASLFVSPWPQASGLSPGLVVLRIEGNGRVGSGRLVVVP
jgi:3',5'-cyclic AMP phosphodiesterase CpdA